MGEAHTSHHEVVICAPVSKVYPYVTNLDNLPNWVGPLKSSELSPDGQVVQTSLLGRNFKAPLQVTNKTEGKSFQYRSSYPVESIWSYQFEPVFGGAHSAIQLVYEIHSTDFFPEGSEGELARNVEASLVNLKRILEN